MILQNRSLDVADVTRVGSQHGHLRYTKIAGIHVPVCGDKLTDRNLMAEFTAIARCEEILREV